MEVVMFQLLKRIYEKMLNLFLHIPYKIYIAETSYILHDLILYDISCKIRHKFLFIYYRDNQFVFLSSTVY